MRPRSITLLCALSMLAGAGGGVRAEDGSQGWLRYAPPLRDGIPASYAKMPAALVNLDASAVRASAQSELLEGVQSMLGRTLRVEAKVSDQDAWILGTEEEIRAALSRAAKRGIANAARMPRIVITTTNSIRVKPR